MLPLPPPIFPLGTFQAQQPQGRIHSWRGVGGGYVRGRGLIGKGAWSARSGRGLVERGRGLTLIVGGAWAGPGKDDVDVIELEAAQGPPET